MEEWRDIKGYEGLYQVSNLGRVKSLKFGKERILKLGISGEGYNFVILSKNGKTILFYVHRLVATEFLGDWSMFCEHINHKDKNRANNKVDNLEWCSIQYNIDYSLSKAVNQYSKSGELIRTWKSAREAERNGYHSGHISYVCLGKRKTHKGYIWRYS